MDISNFKRDPARVRQRLKYVDQALVTTQNCRVYFPYRFTQRNLAEIGAENRCVGIYAIVFEDNFYAVSLAPAMIRMEPTEVNIVKVDGDDYVEFFFQKGSVITPNVNLVKQDVLVYQIYDELVAKGRVPWFFGYEDLGKLFKDTPHHAGVKIGANHAILEMIIASIARTQDDRTKYYRHVVQDKKDLKDNPPVFISLRSVAYGATNTTAKLMGAYFEEGLTSALTNPAEKTEHIEELLRR